MMMTQEQALLKAQEQLQAIQAYVEEASGQQERIDKVERSLFAQLLALGRTLLEGFVAAQGDGDVGPTLDHDECTRKRSADVQPRRYLSIFGELRIERFVYAERP
jgi:small-conductance mechanosensitive channel